MKDKLKKYLKQLSTSITKKKPLWREQEDRLKKSSVLRDYIIKPQKQSKTTNKRTDIFAIHKDNPKNRVIIESKCTAKAQKKHIKQLQEYQFPFFPTKKYIGYLRNTDISDEFRRFAKEKNIGIIRTRLEKTKIRCFPFLTKKKYPM